MHWQLDRLDLDSFILVSDIIIWNTELRIYLNICIEFWKLIT